MAFQYRKLLDESDFDPKLAQKCKSFCDGIKKPLQICSPECLNFCSTYCKNIITQILPPHPPPSDDFDDDYYPPDKSSRAPLILTICLVIVIVSSFFFACYVFYKFCLSRYRTRRRLWHTRRPEIEESGPDEFLDADHRPEVDHPIWYIRTVGLQPAVISAIAIVKYKKGDGLIEGTDCSVCLSEFQENEALRLLPKCNHAFHIPCIDTWLRSHTNCPLCRARIVTNTAASGLPSQELIVRNSGVMEGTDQEGVSESDREVGRESENEVRIEEDNESRDRIVIKMNENLSEEECNSDLNGIQPMRRSVSMDSLAASTISNAISNVFLAKSDVECGHDLVQVKVANCGIVSNKDVTYKRLLKVVGSSSTARSLQAGSSPITRSLSCSAKLFLSRYSSRQRNLVRPR